MDTSLLGKEGNALTVVRERTKPTLITLGDDNRKKVVTSDGKFHANLLADYTIQHGRDRFIPVGEAAGVMFVANTPRNKDKIRRRLSQLAKELKQRGFLLIVEGPPVTSFKVFTGSEIEKQYAENKRGYWEKREASARDWLNYSEAVVASTEAT